MIYKIILKIFNVLSIQGLWMSYTEFLFVPTETQIA